MRKPNGFGSIKKLSGNRRRPYVYVVTRPDGKRQAIQYFTNQTEAEIFQADYVKEHFHRSLPGHKATFSELYYRWLPVHIADIEPSQSTIDNYHNSFRHCVALQEMPVAELKFMHFQQVIDAMKKERLSYSSVKKVRSMISLVLNYGIEYEVVSVNYAPLLKLGKNKPVKPHHPFTRQAINRIWSVADLPGADAVLILLYTGMRCGELLALEKRNVNLRTRIFRITHSKTASGIRTIPIHSRILPFVLARMQLPGKWLLCNESGQPYSYASFCAMWEKVMAACNVRGHTTHDCRHTVATLLDNAGANEAAKKRILGHAGSGVTEAVYTHKNLLQLRKTIQLLK